MVREVVVADAGSRDDTLKVADAAGCTLIEGPADLGARLKRAAAAARAQWLLFLRPDVVLEDGWAGAAEAFIAAAERRGTVDRTAAAFRYSIDADGMVARLAEQAAAIARLLSGRVRPAQGLLIHRRLYDAAGRHPDGRASERRFLGRLGRRVTLLRARAFVQAQD